MNNKKKGQSGFGIPPKYADKERPCLAVAFFTSVLKKINPFMNGRPSKKSNSSNLKFVSIYFGEATVKIFI